MDINNLVSSIVKYIYNHNDENLSKKETVTKNMRKALNEEGSVDFLVANADSYAFYLLAKDFNFSIKHIQERQRLERNIVNNCTQHSYEQVMEAICSLLFRNNCKNVYNQILTIKESAKYLPEVSINYKPYEEFFTAVLNLIENNEIKDNKSKFKNNIKNLSIIVKQIESLGRKSYNVLADLLLIANNQTCINLANSTMQAKKIISNLQPDQLEVGEGKFVKFYKIKNQTKLQRDFYLLTRTCAKSDYMFKPNAMQQWKAFSSKKRAWSYSVVDASRSKGYAGKYRIKFGFFDIGDAKICSSTFRDGQTSQFAMSPEQTIIRQEYTPMNVLVSKTGIGDYNEIQLFKPEEVLPSVLISESEQPTKEEIEIANAFNIPIIFIDTSCYEPPVCNRKKETVEQFNKLCLTYPELLKEPLIEQNKTQFKNV